MNSQGYTHPSPKFGWGRICRTKPGQVQERTWGWRAKAADATLADMMEQTSEAGREAVIAKAKLKAAEENGSE